MILFIFTSMKAEMFGLNGKNGFVTIEPADGTIETNNNTPHITIKAVGKGGGVNSLNGKQQRYNH
jgi:hypothetical protein